MDPIKFINQTNWLLDVPLSAEISPGIGLEGAQRILFPRIVNELTKLDGEVEMVEEPYFIQLEGRTEIEIALKFTDSNKTTKIWVWAGNAPGYGAFIQIERYGPPRAARVFVSNLNKGLNWVLFSGKKEEYRPKVQGQLSNSELGALLNATGIQL